MRLERVLTVVVDDHIQLEPVARTLNERVHVPSDRNFVLVIPNPIGNTSPSEL